MPSVPTFTVIDAGVGSSGSVVFNLTGSRPIVSDIFPADGGLNFLSLDTQLFFGNANGEMTGSVKVQVANRSGSDGNGQGDWRWHDLPNATGTLKGANDRGIIRTPIWEGFWRVVVSGSGIGSGSVRSYGFLKSIG